MLLNLNVVYGLAARKAELPSKIAKLSNLYDADITCQL